MAVQRSTQATLATVISRVRLHASDPDRDRFGNVIENPRFSVGNIVDAINEQLVEMQAYANASHTGESLLSADVTYTPDAADGMDLPEASVPLDSPICHVEDLSDGRRRYSIRYVHPKEIEGYQTDFESDGQTLSPSVYTITAASTGSGQRIRIRPSPASHNIRIWYIAGAFVTDGDTDDIIPLSMRYTEFVALGAAVRLLGEDATDQIRWRFDRAEIAFQRSCDHMLDDDYVRSEYPIE